MLYVSSRLKLMSTFCGVDTDVTAAVARVPYLYSLAPPHVYFLSLSHLCWRGRRARAGEGREGWLARISDSLNKNLDFLQ